MVYGMSCKIASSWVCL